MAKMCTVSIGSCLMLLTSCKMVSGEVLCKSRELARAIFSPRWTSSDGLTCHISCLYLDGCVRVEHYRPSSGHVHAVHVPVPVTIATGE